jgi:hypothetical protein
MSIINTDISIINTNITTYENILYASLYLFYTSNLYFIFNIIKILFTTKYTEYTKKINTDTMCQYICSYTHIVNIPLSIYMYSFNPDEIYLCDIIGISFLTYTSFRYHYNLYENLYLKKYDEYKVPNKDNIIYFYNDFVCINLRSFLVLFCNYYYHPYSSYVSLFSGIVHIISVYLSTLNMLQLLQNNVTKNTFLNIHYIFNIFACGFDCLLVFMNSSYQVRIPFILTNLSIIMVFVVEPFDKLTHVLFHVLLIIQNYYMCISNMEAGQLYLHLES